MLEKGIIVGVNVNEQDSFEEEMVELKNLCEACNIEVVDQMVQNAKSIHPKTYVGTGKLEELATLVQNLGASVVIFHTELTPSQIKHIDDAVQVEVIDRTGLILEIFANRAKTREAKLQVEVVKLQYELPRLVGLNRNLSRQAGGIGGVGGGASAGGRNKGAGETKLELNRRQIDDKISQLQKELEALTIQRTTQRGRRKKNGLPVVALVGYTNAGKSSIMNYMVNQFVRDEKKQVFEKNMLFATLETSVRQIKLPNRKEFLLSDTVGFVSNLPHNLVKAFRSTLEEVCEADLLLHVVDRSNPDYEMQMEVTKQTLKEIGADEIPCIYVYNKMDLTEPCETWNYGSTSEKNAYVSAKTGEGMEQLIQNISNQIFSNDQKVQVLIPYECGTLIAKIKASANVLSEQCKDQGIEYEVECGPQTMELVRKYLVTP